MELIEKITQALKESKMRNWNRLSLSIGKPRTYGGAIKRLTKARIEKINRLLGKFGYELDIKRKSKS